MIMKIALVIISSLFLGAMLWVLRCELEKRNPFVKNKIKYMKSNLKIALITIAAMASLFLVLSTSIKSSKKFDANFHPAIESKVGADGRAAVGSAAYWTINISPALCWKKGDNSVKIWRFIGWFLLLVIAAYTAAAIAGYLEFNNYIGFVSFAVALSCYVAAYSSAFSNNTVDVSVAQFEKIKNDPAALADLFAKPLIK
jgi:hypothetical protein